MAKTRMLVLCGGRSEEHEVSLLSARSLIAALHGSDIEATALVITRAGRWLTPGESRRALSDGKAPTGGALTLHSAHVAEEYDVVFPLLHGPFGEDGTVQGLLEMAGLPYVGSGVLASALCMDKVMAKAVLASRGIRQVRHTLVTRHDMRGDPEAALARCRALTPPWFVKPANLGSSVGISKAKDEAALREGLTAALKLDRRAIVEEGVPGARELEVAILGNDEPKPSIVGEITYQAEFYDYATKYTEGRAQLIIPAPVPAAVAQRVQEMALIAYQALDCAGFARIDFFYREQANDLLLNEANTIPGFTPFSMYTKLWEATGVPYPKLVQKLVELALERRRERG